MVLTKRVVAASGALQVVFLMEHADKWETEWARKNKVTDIC